MSAVRSEMLAHAYFEWFLADSRDEMRARAVFQEMRVKAPGLVVFAARVRATWFLAQAPWRRWGL